MSLLILATAPLCLAQVTKKSKKTKTIKLQTTDTILSAAMLEGGNTSCLKKDGQVMSGKVMGNFKKFRPASLSYKTKLKLFKQKIKAAKKEKNKNKLKKLSKQKAKFMQSYSQAETACLSAFREHECTVSAPPYYYSIIENQEVAFTVQATSTCSAPLSYILHVPAAGKAEQTGPDSFVYHPGFTTETQTLTYTACAGDAKCTSGNIVFYIQAGQLVGRNDSLNRYRDTLTNQEARHLIRKIAFNDSFSVPEGENINLDDLLNRLLDIDHINPDLKPFLEELRDGRRFTRSGVTSLVVAENDWGDPIFNSSDSFETPEEQREALTRYLNITGKGYNPNIDYLHWGIPYSTPHLTARARYLSPLQARMTHFWFGHFGTAMHELGGWDTEFYIRDYFHLIYDNALSDLKRLVLGTSRDACLSDGNGGGILCDAASNRWLSNTLNTKTTPNQNFARELLELYLMGPYDHFSQEPNYVEDDVVATTAFVSGFKIERYREPKGYGNNPTALADRSRLLWDNTRHDFGEYTAFAGRPFEYRGSATPTEFVSHLIDKHPATAKFIAGKVFRSLAYPDPSEKLVLELAQKFRDSNFNIASLIYYIASSEAMFSPKAVEPTCIKSPFEISTELYRNFNFRVVNPYYVDGPGDARHGFWSSFMNLANELAAAGEDLLDYPTVFTYSYCGRDPKAIGKNWTDSVSLLYRTKMSFTQVNRAQHYDVNMYDFSNLREKMLLPGQSLNTLTPQQAIDYIKRVFNISISEQENQILLDYLLKNINTSGQLTDTEWKPEDKTFMRNKIAGLVVIFTNMAQSNLR